MKVISLLQPWATLVVIGAKKIETRSFDTKYRGELLIHASAGKKPWCRSCMLDFQQQFFTLQLPHYKDLPFGAILGKVNLNHTVSSEVCFKDNEFEHNGHKWLMTEQEIAFGDYSPNRYGWLLKDAVQFAEPIPAKGQLGLWNYDMPDHIHIPNKYGGHATFGSPPDKETLEAVNKLTELAHHSITKHDNSTGIF